MSRWSLRARLTATLAVVALVALAILTAGFNLLLRASLQADADRVLRSAAESALETVRVDPSGRLRLLEAPEPQDSGSRIWVYSGSRALERPREPDSVQRLADSLAGSDEAFSDQAASDTRLYSRAVGSAGGQPAGTVVAAISVEPYERTAAKALYASLIFAASTLAAVVLMGRLLIGRALRPVSQMTREATDWSEHDLDHRFGAGEPHDEITELAAAFDSMLERLASSLRHEQRLSAEISHELRTPTAAILAEAELALAGDSSPAQLRPALERIEDRARQLSRILAALLAAARAEMGTGHPTSVAEVAVERALSDQAERAGEREIELRAGDATAHAVDVDGELVERALAPLIENAIRHASSMVEADVGASADRVLVTIRDDGAGVPRGRLERIFEPGFSESPEPASDATIAGAGLGLALSRRLARSAGGDVRALEVPAGAAFELSLPAG